MLTAIDNAKAQRAQLSAATDGLNRVLLAAENTLTALKLGVKASAQLDDYRFLVFEKTGKRWGLSIESRGDIADWTVPILSASREERSFGLLQRINERLRGLDGIVHARHLFLHRPFKRQNQTGKRSGSHQAVGCEVQVALSQAEESK
jgi:hypothetical protein